MNILFVCSGNICRSPMAEALSRELFRERGREEIEIRSAGTLGIEDRPASPEAIAVMKEIDIDLSGHRSCGLSPELVEWADVVAVMEPRHKEAVLELSGERRPSIYALWEYSSRPDADRIADPIGRPMEFYLDCRDELKECLSRFVTELYGPPR